MSDDDPFGPCENEYRAGGDAEPSKETCRNAPGTTADCNCVSGFACPFYDPETIEAMWRETE